MGYVRRLGRDARDPHTAAMLVTASAIAFTALWVGWVNEYSASYMPEWVFLVLVPPNAYFVTRLAWRLCVAPAQQFTSRRALGVGVGAGLLAYVSLSFLLGLYVGLYDLFVGIPPAVLRPSGPIDWVLVSTVYGPLVAIIFTAGIPVVLTTGIALLLARFHREYSEPDGKPA